MIRITMLSLLILLSSCGALIQLTDQKASIKETSSTSIELNGVLGKQMHKKLSKYLSENSGIQKIILNQIPGSMNDEWNVKTCLLINKRHIETYLKSKSIIASGGVDLFISGTKRTIEKGAIIGVHSWSDGKKDGSEYPNDSKEHDLFIDFFNQIEVDTSFYWFTLKAAPAKDIYWMTAHDIEKYRLKKN